MSGRGLSGTLPALGFGLQRPLDGGLVGKLGERLLGFGGVAGCKAQQAPQPFLITTRSHERSQLPGLARVLDCSLNGPHGVKPFRLGASA
jgi:hypothetical protein